MGCNEDDIKNLKELFDLYDTDSDDALSIIEVDIILRYLQLSPSMKQLKELFKDADLDDSGNISFSEFCVLMGIDSETSTEKVNSEVVDHDSIVEKSFHMFDTDNNGVISLSELGQVMQLLDQRRHKEHELDRIMSSIDRDNSGTINLTEFQDLLTKTEEQNIPHKQFTQIDKDDNGLISINELYSWLISGGEKITPQQVKTVYMAADVNENGWVDFEEFVKITK